MESVKTRIDAASVATFLVFFLVGAMLVSRPLGLPGLIGGVTALSLMVVVLRRAGHAGMGVWQILTLAALSGYVVLNYGFANLAFRLGGIPIIVGHTLVFAALGLAVFACRGRVAVALREPAMVCVLVLLLMSIPHLVLDIPRYGLYAVRDASLFFEGIFMLLGLLWATDRHNTGPLVKWLLFIFLANTVYSCSTFWSETLSSLPPISGIFQSVPLWGSYAQTYLYLLAGALFCLLIGRQAARWPGWVWFVFAAVQVFGLAIAQARSMYIGILIALLLLALAGEMRKVGRLVGILSVGLVAILLLTSFAGVEIPGRIGPVSLGFLEAHARGLLFDRGAPAEGSIEDREDWYRDVWKRSQSSATNFLVGEGFGLPLTDEIVRPGIISRQPHNSHLTILARLGLAGVIVWGLFHLLILRRFLQTFVRRHHLEGKSWALVLWFFLYYMLFMLVTSVQPLVEFSYGAIPFYFLMGFALGFMRWQLRPGPVANRDQIAVASGIKRA